MDERPIEKLTALRESSFGTNTKNEKLWTGSALKKEGEVGG